MLIKRRSLASAVFVALALVACGGDDGNDGQNGSNGSDGAAGGDGLQSLVKQTALSAGHWQCFKGGIQLDSGLDADADGVLSATEVNETSYVCSPSVIDTHKNFNRIANFPVCKQIDANCDTDVETAAEIVTASKDGMMLIYSDSPNNQIGFVDIADAHDPVAAGVTVLAGEPTSVYVKDEYVLVGVNTSADYVNVSGTLDVVSIETQSVVRSIDLGGQPDSVAVSPDGQYAVVAIENERDEDLDDGALPQMPAGQIVVVDLSGDVSAWSTSVVDIAGLADLYGSDPEPEYVDINNENIAVVTLQENNYIILLDLATGAVLNHFTAGAADLDMIDIDEDSGERIQQDQSLSGVLREPDGVSWINKDYFATADEGDLDGGSRGFTIFNKRGEVVWTAGNLLEHLTARFGHYPEARSENKGNEPENIELGVYGSDRFLFVNSERSSLVFVFDVADPTSPVYKQALPAAKAPEGVLAIPSRNLLIAASEEEARDDGMRGAINVYSLGYEQAQYPTLVSGDRTNGSPIPWAALSGLSADPLYNNRLYAVDDSYFLSNRIFTIDTDVRPARIIKETYVSDANDVFANFAAEALADGTVDDDHESRINVFDEADLALMINDDKTVNLDLEGISKASDGGYWLASEGDGTIGDDKRPVNSLNFIFKTDSVGVIEEVITLPSSLNMKQVRYGFEGVAEYAGKLYVAVQRAWADDAHPRIAIYDIETKLWTSVFYPLDASESQVDDAWVGLSDITSIGEGKFLVVERDNKAGLDAAIKRMYLVDLSLVVDGQLISKVLAKDLLGDLLATGGAVIEKVEGSAYTPSGDVYVLTDNDGVDDNSGETQLLKIDGVNLAL